MGAAADKVITAEDVTAEKVESSIPVAAATAPPTPGTATSLKF